MRLKLREWLSDQPASAARLGADLAAARSNLRRQLNLAGPVVACGHQAEFFHAGVFAKIIATHILAGQLGGQAVFLTVDCDLPKSSELIVPQITSRGLRRVAVAIPGCDRRLAFEWQPAQPRSQWLEFFARVTSLLDFGDRSALPIFARGWLGSPDPQPQYCDALGSGRAAVEADLGLTGVRELRVSRLCDQSAFRLLMARMLTEPRRCAEDYNRALEGYRQRHRLRAAGQPAPRLQVSDQVVELPLWAVHPRLPRRRLLVAPHADWFELRAETDFVGRFQPAELVGAASRNSAWPFEPEGWQLRPRAISLSALARLLLADLFIHGVGGAKYDEVTEDFVRAFFGVEPAPASCVSATLHLPLPREGIRPQDINAAQQQSRDLRYNPQRHLRGLPAELLQERARLIEQSRTLSKDQPWDHDARRLVFQAIRRINQTMLQTDPWKAAEYDQRVETLRMLWERDQIADDRGYFYALHLRDSLAQLVSRMGRLLAGW